MNCKRWAFFVIVSITQGHLLWCQCEKCMLASNCYCFPYPVDALQIWLSAKFDKMDQKPTDVEKFIHWETIIRASESTVPRLIRMAHESYLRAMLAQQIWTRVFNKNKLNFNSNNQWKSVTPCNEFNLYIHICALVPDWANLRKYGERFISDQLICKFYYHSLHHACH